MDIDKLKSAVEIKLNQARVVKVPNYITSGLTEEADKIFIDLATQVIEVSEAMPKKREVVGRDPYNTTDAMNDSFNQCHDEFVLWLMKKLADIKCNLLSLRDKERDPFVRYQDSMCSKAYLIDLIVANIRNQIVGGESNEQ